VLEFAERQRWTVIPHGKFVSWAATAIPRDAGTWLVLDPLLSSQPGDVNVIPVRIYRAAQSGSFEIADWKADEIRGRDVAIVDDAAATGRTLLCMAHIASSHGARPSVFAVAAATDFARQSLAAAFPAARWLTFMRDDWSICHMRDGCPFLPFSGRNVGAPRVVANDHASIEVRAPMWTAVNSLWFTLAMQRPIRAVIDTMRATVCTGLAAILGRQPTAADVRLLGPGVPLTVGTHVQQVTATCPIPDVPSSAHVMTALMV